MNGKTPTRRPLTRTSVCRFGSLLLVAGLLGLSACAPTRPATTEAPEATAPEPSTAPQAEATSVGEPPSPDPRVGLEAGLFDAEEAIWNLRLLSATPPPEAFVGVTNSDLAFTGDYAIQGNYNGIQVWDISDPSTPELVTEYVCPASQSDVSVYENLLFVSGEGLEGRLDCGTEGVPETASPDRLRGIRIFDISDIRNPEYVANVQTCRGSHTHSVLKDPSDDENVYVYVSGSAPVRPEEELPGCSGALPEEDPNSALFRIEVIQVPLDAPEEAAIVSSPRIFEDLAAPPQHGPAPEDLAELEEARARGDFIVEVMGQPFVVPTQVTTQMLAGIVEGRGGSGEPTAADSAALQENLEAMVAERLGGAEDRGPTQCHDITLYPEIGLAGGACEGYGLLLDISDPANPTRIDAVADSNFAYWHSATFNNDGTKVLFTDEWGGGGQPKCRETDPSEWGANAIFTLDDGEMDFASYYKIAAPQTAGGELRRPQRLPHPHPRPRRHGAVVVPGAASPSSTGPTRPAPSRSPYHDRGPIDPDQMVMGGELVGVLVQRRHRELGDRARPRRLRARAEPVPLRERDRRGEHGRARLPQRAGAAPVRLAGHLRPRPRLPRPARAVGGPGCRAGRVGAADARRRRGGLGRGAAGGARRTGSDARWRSRRRPRRGEGGDAGGRRRRPGDGRRMSRNALELCI